MPGLDKIALPLPMRNLAYVFVYLFRDGNENLLVDTGWNDERTHESLMEAFSKIGFQASDLKNILVSHLHPDHIGLASRLKREVPSARILMHERDARDMVHTKEAYEIFANSMETFLRRHGTPEKELEDMITSVRGLEDQFVGAAKADILLKGGEKLAAGRWNLEIVSAPGHTRGNICVYEKNERILFSGDHILPKITPNVSLSPIYDVDPLGDYLRSIASMAKLDPRKVIPSHEYVFENLGKRIEEIEEHHKKRLSRILKALESVEDASGYEVARKLPWSQGSFDKLSPWQKRAAVTETLAHLEYLKRNGKAFVYLEGSNEAVKFARSS